MPSKGTPTEFTTQVERGALTTFSAGARLAAREFARRHPDLAQKHDVLDPGKELYALMTLTDRSEHWVITLLDHESEPLVSALCQDNASGAWYTLCVRETCVQSVEVLPPALVEKLPPAEQPFGFAAHPSASGRKE